MAGQTAWVNKREQLGQREVGGAALQIIDDDGDARQPSDSRKNSATSDGCK
jgi:hypothetical protein